MINIKYFIRKYSLVFIVISLLVMFYLIIKLIDSKIIYVEPVKSNNELFMEMKQAQMNYWEAIEIIKFYEMVLPQLKQKMDVAERMYHTRLLNNN